VAVPWIARLISRVTELGNSETDDRIAVKKQSDAVEWIADKATLPGLSLKDENHGWID
jgi:hypothetical protein